MGRRGECTLSWARGGMGALLLGGAALLVGCEALAVTALGVGAGVGGGTAVSYTMDGIAYKTFTAPVPKVRQATLAALKKMDLKPQPVEPAQSGGPSTIKAKGQDRQIEIQLEPLSTQTTRIRVIARDGIFFKDKATATEIIYQVADALDQGRG